jgi:Cys-tRNA(Pro)/Cys-tRNA(Cys) deacylase
VSTRAIAWLKKKKIRHEVVQYEHEKKGAAFAARAIGFPLEKTIKTLVVDLGEKTYALALMPGDRELVLKKMAQACGVKKAAMADPATAERLTGYHVGGISPLGLRQRLPVVMEESLLAHGAVMINGGQRGIMLKMAPEDILAATGGHAAMLA